MSTILVASCNYSDITEAPHPEERIYETDELKEISLNFPEKECQCDVEDSFFIKAVINEKLICFTDVEHPISNDLIRDQILIKRTSKDGLSWIRMDYRNPQIFNSMFPHVLTSEKEYCETISLEILNNKPTNLCTTCPQSDAYFQGVSGSGLNFTITGFVDNILIGTFDGQVVNHGKFPIKVQNGEFKIKINQKGNNPI